MSDHAKRLRHMAEGWRQTAEGTEKYGLPREKARDIEHYTAQAAALLAGAEALERTTWRPIEECQIASWGDEEHIVWARFNGEWFIAAAQLFKADAIQEGYTHFMRLPKLGSASEEGQ